MELFVGGCILILTVCIIDALRPRGYGPSNPMMGSGHGGMQSQSSPMQHTQHQPMQQNQQHFSNQPNQGDGRQVRGNGSEMMVWVILALLIIGTLVVLMPDIQT